MDKAVRISARDAEHIEASHGDLNEQDAAALQIGEEDLDDRIRHKDNAEQDHDPAGDAAEAQQRPCRQIGYRFHGIELLHDLSGHIPDGCPIAGECRGEGPLQRNAQLIKPDRNNGEEADSHKALDGIEGGLTDIAAAAGILHAAFKAGHHQPCAVECPCQIGEEQHDALHPIHGEELRAHVSHLCEEVAEKAHDLTVKPVHDLTQDLVSNEIPNEH